MAPDLINIYGVPVACAQLLEGSLRPKQSKDSVSGPVTTGPGGAGVGRSVQRKMRRQMSSLGSMMCRWKWQTGAGAFGYLGFH